MHTIIKEVKFNNQSLVAAIAQQYDSLEVIMMAWMHKEALIKTIETGYVHYFSRSRNKMWKKGESSGQIQKLKEIIVDCDGDTLLIKIDQQGVGCHTGRASCFFKTLDYKNDSINITKDVIVAPEILYKQKK